MVAYSHVQVHEGDSNAYQDQEDARQDQVHEEGRSHREEHEEDGREVQGLSVDEARHGEKPWRAFVYSGLLVACDGVAVETVEGLLDLRRAVRQSPLPVLLR